MNRIRNTFKKPPTTNGLGPVQDENARPPSGTETDSLHSSYAGSRASSSLSIKKKEEPAEYKLSVVNGGVYLPPSPPEKKSYWPKSPMSSRTNSHRSMLNENEPFSISRESFESYRRSFDISARSPVNPNEASTTPRQSLDAKATGTPKPRLSSSQFERPAPTGEELFEDVGLDGSTKPADVAKQPANKKKGIFSRFGETQSEPPASGEAPRPNSSHRGFHLPGRRRGQSGQGAELGNIDRLGTQEGDDRIVK